MRHVGDLFRFGLTEGAIVLLLFDLGSLPSIAQIPAECEIVLHFKVMMARNKRDGKTNRTSVQITPTQGCELITTGLVPSFSHPNKLGKASQNREKRVFPTLATRKRLRCQTVSHDSRQLRARQITTMAVLLI